MNAWMNWYMGIKVWSNKLIKDRFKKIQLQTYRNYEYFFINKLVQSVIETIWYEKIYTVQLTALPVMISKWPSSHAWNSRGERQYDRRDPVRVECGTEDIRVSECVSVWLSVWVSVWVSVSECVSEWVCEWVSVWVSVWVSEWVTCHLEEKGWVVTKLLQLNLYMCPSNYSSSYLSYQS